MDRGAMALQINEGKAKLVHLPDPPPSESKTVRRIDATLAADGSAIVDWRAEVTGASASSWRARYHADAARKQRLLEDLGVELPSLAIEKIDTGKLDDVEAPVSLHVKAKVPMLARNESGGASVAAGPREHLVRDYASSSSRKLDLRLGAKNTQITEWTIHIPQGMRITSAPKDARETSPFGSYEVTVEQGAGVIKVKTTITLDRSRILVSEYPAFRAFCESADRALGQRVVYGK